MFGGLKSVLNLLNNGEELVDLFVNNLTPYGFISVNYGDLVTLFNTNKEYINEDIYLLFEWLLKKNDTILNKIFNTSAIIDKYDKLKLKKT